MKKNVELKRKRSEMWAGLSEFLLLVLFLSESLSLVLLLSVLLRCVPLMSVVSAVCLESLSMSFETKVIIVSNALVIVRFH